MARKTAGEERTAPYLQGEGKVEVTLESRSGTCWVRLRGPAFG